MGRVMMSERELHRVEVLAQVDDGAIQSPSLPSSPKPGNVPRALSIESGRMLKFLCLRKTPCHQGSESEVRRFSRSSVTSRFCVVCFFSLHVS
ncbi:MAG TPA: hypothetical protein DEO85_05695 [Maritimibacter sp.]|nr:hypothetical protein [Maritimibacter sp.]